jgi:hypothetical protein
MTCHGGHQIYNPHATRQYLEPAVVRPEAGRLLVKERRAPETTRESGDGARERRERWLVAGWQV